MALACRVLSVAKSSRYLLMPRRFERLFCVTSSTSGSPSDPLISRLLQVPISQIKTTLDSVDIFALNSSQFSWDALITSLRSSSPQKAQLVFPALEPSFFFFNCYYSQDNKSFIYLLIFCFQLKFLVNIIL